MDTYTPEQLLSLWQREKPPPETVVGHIIQNLIRLQQAHNTHTRAHHALKREGDQRQKEIERLKGEVSRLQADLNRLRADFEVFKKAQTNPPTKGKKKLPPK